MFCRQNKYILTAKQVIFILWNISRTFANKKISIEWLTKDNY